MKIILRISSALVLILILLFGLAIFYFKSIFTEEKIRKFAQDMVSKSIPEGQLHLGKLEINPGLNFEVKIDDLIISNRGELNRENALIYIKNLFFKLPIYSILDNTPEIDLHVSEAEIRSFENPPSNVLEEKVETPLPVVENIQSPPNKSFFQKYKVKAQKHGDMLLKNAHLNFSSQKLSFFRIYLEREIKEVKCLNIKIRFEGINRPLFLQLKCDGDTGEKEPGLKGVISLRGNINIKELLTNKNLNFSGSFILEKPNWQPIGNIPTIRGEVEKLVINNEGVKVPIKASVDNWGSGFLIIDTRSGDTILDSLDWNFNIEVLDFLLKKMPFSRKGQFDLKGKLSFLEKGFFPEIDLKTKNMVLTLKETNIPVSISGKIEGENYNMKALVNIFNGSSASDIAGSINWNDLSKAFGPMKINTLISSMEFKVSKKEGKKIEKKEANKNDFEYPLPNFPLDLKMKIDKVKLEKISINGTGTLSIGKKKKSKLSMKVTLGDASANLNAKLLDLKNNASMDFNLKGFDLALLENLIPEKLGVFKGRADLDFNGTLPFPHFNSQGLSFKVNLLAVKGDYNNPSMGKNWDVFIKENPGLEKYISKNAQPYVEFDQILVNGEIDKGVIVLNKFLFQAPSDKLLIHADGKIGLDETKKSLLYVDMRDKIGITLPGMKKLFGMETLYFKLTGKGLKLKPDLAYTSSKILEKTATELPKNLWSPVDKILIDPFRKIDKSLKKKP